MDLHPLGSACHQYPWKSYPRSLDCCWEKWYGSGGTLCLSLTLWHTENAWIRYLWSVAEGSRRLIIFSVTGLQHKTCACFYPRWQCNTRSLPMSASGRWDNNVFWILTKREVSQIRPLTLRPSLELVLYSLTLLWRMFFPLVAHSSVSV